MCWEQKGAYSEIRCVQVPDFQYLRYAVISVHEPMMDPFHLIPGAYQKLQEYVKEQGMVCAECENVIPCFERQYVVDGTEYMDIYMAVK